MRYFIFLLLVLLGNSCVTFVDDPGKFRQEKSVGVGGGTGISDFTFDYINYANKKNAIHLSFAYQPKSFEIYNIDAQKTSINLDSNDESEYVKVNERKNSINFDYWLFPYDKSSLFLGAGVNYGEKQSAYSHASPQSENGITNIEWSDYQTSLSGIVGISKNTTTNLTFTTGVKFIRVVNNVQKFIDDGADDEVDAIVRDKNITAVEAARSKSIEFFTAMTSHF